MPYDSLVIQPYGEHCTHVFFAETEYSSEHSLTITHAEARLGELLQAGNHLLLDLSRVEKMEAPLVGAFVRFVHKTRQTNFSYAFVGIKKDILEKLQLRNLGNIFRNYTTLAEAAAALTTTPAPT